MKNIIVTLIEFLAIGLLVSWERSIVDWLWLLQILGYSGFQLISEKNKKVEANDLDVCLRDIIISNVINITVLLIILSSVYFIFEGYPKSRSCNTFLFPLYLLLNANVIKQSIGMKCKKIKVINDRLIEKMKILLNNFLIISPVYVMFFCKKWDFLYDYHKALMEFLLFLNVCNLFVRLMVDRKRSLYELILNVGYEKIV